MTTFYLLTQQFPYTNGAALTQKGVNTMSFHATAGQTYYLRVASDNQTTFELEAAYSVADPNAELLVTVQESDVLEGNDFDVFDRHNRSSTFCATGGATYYIRVSSKDGDQRAFAGQFAFHQKSSQIVDARFSPPTITIGSTSQLVWNNPSILPVYINGEQYNPTGYLTYGPFANTGTVTETISSPSSQYISFIPGVPVGGHPPYKYRVFPRLPIGLCVSSVTGIIQGVPTSYLPRTHYSYTVEDSVGQLSSTPFHLEITTTPIELVIHSQSVVALLNTPIDTAIVSSTGGFGVVNYTISPSLPPGLRLDPVTGNIVGTATATAPQRTYIVTATDLAGQAAETEIVASVVVIPVKVTPTKRVFRYTLFQEVNPIAMASARGGHSALSFSISPTLPATLAFNTGTSTISGIPTIVYDDSYTIVARDQWGNSDSTTVEVSVIPLPLIVESRYDTLVFNLNQFVGVMPLVRVIKANGAVSYSINPPLPRGLFFNNQTGEVSGTPLDTSGYITYTITASDQSGQFETIDLEIASILNTLLLSITSSSLSTVVGVEVGAVYPGRVSGNNGNVTYSINPALPTALNLDTRTGKLSGIPQAISPPYVYTLTVRDALNRTASGSFTLSVVSPKLSVSTNIYSVMFQTNTPVSGVYPVISGGGTNIEFFITPDLPQGLELNRSTGEITGYCTAEYGPELHVISVVSSDGQSGLATVMLQVLGNAYTVPLLVRALDICTDYPIDLSVCSDAFNETSTFSAQDLPPGLVLSASGQLSGSATLEGEWVATVTATNGVATASATLNASVSNQLLPNRYVVDEVSYIARYISNEQSQLISGSLPPGLEVMDTRIVGQPTYTL